MAELFHMVLDIVDVLKKFVVPVIVHSRYICERCVRMNPLFFKNMAVLYIISFLAIYPYLYHRSPYSLYWIPQGHKDLIQQVSANNQEQFIAAKNYLRPIKSNLNIIDNPFMVVSVITVKRVEANRPLGYLTQVLAQVEKIKTENTIEEGIQIIICDTYAGPGPHTEADLLASSFIRKQRFPAGNSSAVIMDSFEKEKQDYTFCLEEAIKLNPQYVLMLEDDAVPHEEMIAVLQDKIQWLNENRTGKLGWSFLKLFYPERWQGYGFELIKLLELGSIFILGGFGFILLHNKTYQMKHFRHSKKDSLLMQIVAFALGGIFCALSCIVIGRTNILHLRTISNHLYSLRSAPNCCSPAILYPVGTAKLLTDMLKQIVCHHNFPLDMGIAKFLEETETSGYIVEPNLVKHIGLVSSIKGMSKYPWEFI